MKGFLEVSYGFCLAETHDPRGMMSVSRYLISRKVDPCRSAIHEH